MTNQFPQDPQNPIPERRQRPAAGVTFDEMIAIVVAFSTIGAILFWSLGGRRSSIANNLGIGENDSVFSLGEDAATISGSNANLELEADSLEIAGGSTRLESITLAPDSAELDVAPEPEFQSYGLDRSTRYNPLAGVATTLPAITNNSNVNTAEIEVEEAEIEVEEAEREEPVATTPEKVEEPEAAPPEKVEEPVATTPDKVEMPDDIAPSYWAYPFVKSMNEQLEIAEFADDQNFEPNKLITRAGMATLISQAFDNKPTNENIKKFKDVTNQNALAADIDKAVRTGFMQGYSDDEFRPLENIPRYQVLVTLATGLGLKPSQDPSQILQQFDDSTDFPEWAREQVAAAAEAGLIVNPPDRGNSLNPNEPATRGEVAAMIHQALVETGRLKPLESEYIVK